MFHFKIEKYSKILFCAMILCLVGIISLSIININRKGYVGTYTGKLHYKPWEITLEESDLGYSMYFDCLDESATGDDIDNDTITVDPDKTLSYMDYSFIFDKDRLYVSSNGVSYIIFEKKISNPLPVIIAILIVAFSLLWSGFLFCIPGKGLKEKIVMGIIMLVIILGNMYLSLACSDSYTGNIPGYESIFSQIPASTPAKVSFAEKSDYTMAFYEYEEDNYYYDQMVFYRNEDGLLHEMVGSDGLYLIPDYFSYTEPEYTKTIVDKSVFLAEVNVNQNFKVTESFTLYKKSNFIYRLILLMLPAYVIKFFLIKGKRKLKVLKIDNKKETKKSYYVSGILYSDRLYEGMVDYIGANMEGSKVVPGRKSLEFGDQIIEASKERNHYISDSGLHYIFRDEEASAVLDILAGDKVMFSYKLMTEWETNNEVD